MGAFFFMNPPHGRPRLIVTVGLPGSGKSTYLAAQGVTPLSSDLVRQLLADDITSQAVNRIVFRTLRSLVRCRLRLGRPATYVDATHLAPWERRPYLAMAALYDCSAEALFFDVPLETCLARNRTRSRVVPEEVMAAMARRLVPPTLEEGFSRITVIRP